MSDDRWPGDRKRREALIRLKLPDLAGWHLLASCAACQADRMVRMDTLLDRYGPHVTLAELLPRLRCRAPACRQPPTRVMLRNRLPMHPGPPLIDVMLKEPGGALTR